jgi:outer membrane biosynthesis protein TonB
MMSIVLQLAYNHRRIYTYFTAFYFILLIFTFLLKGGNKIVSSETVISASSIRSITVSSKSKSSVKIEESENTQPEAKQPVQEKPKLDSGIKLSDLLMVVDILQKEKADVEKPKKNDAKIEQKPAEKFDTSNVKSSNSTPADSNKQDFKPDAVTGSAPLATQAFYQANVNQLPKYPLISYQMGESGEVVIEYQISAFGKILIYKIVQSSGYTK